MSVALFACFESRLRPVVEKMAVSRASYIANKTINDAIINEIANGDIAYDDFIVFEKDTQNRITALRTNMASVNSLRVRMVDLILEKILEIDTSKISIPLGNIVNGELFSGRGPRIPIKLLPVGMADVNFKSQFSSAGINQTRHQILMVVTLSIQVILPGNSVTTKVTTEVNVAETVIVGNVPNSYAYFEENTDIPNSQKYMIVR